MSMVLLGALMCLVGLFLLFTKRYSKVGLFLLGTVFLISVVLPFVFIALGLYTALDTIGLVCLVC